MKGQIVPIDIIPPCYIDSPAKEKNDEARILTIFQWTIRASLQGCSPQVYLTTTFPVAWPRSPYNLKKYSPLPRSPRSMSCSPVVIPE